MATNMLSTGLPQSMVEWHIYLLSNITFWSPRAMCSIHILSSWLVWRCLCGDIFFATSCNTELWAKNILIEMHRHQCNSFKHKRKPTTELSWELSNEHAIQMKAEQVTKGRAKLALGNIRKKTFGCNWPCLEKWSCGDKSSTVLIPISCLHFTCPTERTCGWLLCTSMLCFLHSVQSATQPEHSKAGHESRPTIAAT